MGGQAGCDRRIEVFGKVHTKKIGGGGGREGSGGGSGCENSKKIGRGCLVGGVRVDVNEELKFL